MLFNSNPKYDLCAEALIEKEQHISYYADKNSDQYKYLGAPNHFKIGHLKYLESIRNSYILKLPNQEPKKSLNL